MRIIKYIRYQIFKKTKAKPSNPGRDNDLHGIIFHLRLRPFQGKESTWLRLAMGYARKTERKSGCSLGSCIKKMDGPCYRSGSEIERGNAFKGFSERRSLLSILSSITIISFPSSVTSKLNRIYMQYTTYYPVWSHSICPPNPSLVYSFENIKGSKKFTEMRIFTIEIGSCTLKLTFANLS